MPRSWSSRDRELVTRPLEIGGSLLAFSFLILHGPSLQIWSGWAPAAFTPHCLLQAWLV